MNSETSMKEIMAQAQPSNCDGLPPVKLSIGIPIYNGENFIAQLLDCLLAQTFQDFEIVVCDNVSTDNTASIVRAYAEKDSRIRYFCNEENVGPIENFNRVFRHSRGTYMKWSCHDDLYAPTFLERCVQVLDEYPDVVAAGTDSVFVDANVRAFQFDKQTRRHYDPVSGATLQADPIDMGAARSAVMRFADVLFHSDHSHIVFGAIRRDVLLKTSLFRQLYECDYRLLLELALHGKFHHHREKLFFKRFHPGMSAALERSKAKTAFMGKQAAVKAWRFRRFKESLLTPWNAQIGWPTRLGCCAVVVGFAIGYVPILALRAAGLMRVPNDMRVAALKSATPKEANPTTVGPGSEAAR